MPGTFLLWGLVFRAVLKLGLLSCILFSGEGHVHFFPEGKTLKEKEGTGAQNLARKCLPGSRRAGPDRVHAPHVALGRDAGLWRPPARGRQSGVAMGGASECPAGPGWDVGARCWAAVTASYWPGLLRLLTTMGDPDCANLLTSNSSKRPCSFARRAKLSHIPKHLGGARPTRGWPQQESRLGKRSNTRD